MRTRRDRRLSTKGAARMVCVGDPADLPDLLALFRSEGVSPDMLAEALEKELDAGGIDLERLAAYHATEWPPWAPATVQDGV